MNATAAELFWWVALPYLALGVFIVIMMTIAIARTSKRLD